MGNNPFTSKERNVLRPRPRLMPVDWAESNVVVGRDSPVPGRFSRETMPLLSSPMNAILDPRYQEIAAVASTQSGKSQAMNQIILGYWLEYARRHTAFGIANRKIANRVYKTKLKPMFDAVPSLSALLPRGGAGSRGGFPTEQLLTNGALWLFLGAGSAADMSQATVESLVIDETDKADGEAASGKEANPIEQMIRRTDAHHLTRRIVYTCTPTVKAGFIWKKFLSGTEGKPWFRCIGCGEWFWFEWSWENQRIGWEDDASEVSAMETAFYPCPRCERKLRDEDRLTMLRFPLWVHEGEKIEACSADEAEAAGAFDEAIVLPDGDAFRVTGTRKATRTVSFWWNRLTSPFTTLGHLASDLRNARGEEARRHAVTIYDMALPYEGRILDSSELDPDTILSHIRFSDYRSGRRGRMPFRFDPKKIIVTGGIDIGKYELFAVFDAWEADAEGFCLQSWRIAYLLPYRYPHPQDPDAIFRALEHVREWLLPGFKDSDGKDFWPRAIGIDTGYQGLKTRRARVVGGGDDQVYRFVRSYDQRTWRAVKGEETLAEGRIYDRTRLKNGVYLWRIDTDLAKCEIHSMLRIPPGKTGFWHLPQDTSRDYARGLCAEKRVVEFDDRNMEQARWVRESPYNHPLDCEVYSWTMARYYGIKSPRGESPDGGGEGENDNDGGNENEQAQEAEETGRDRDDRAAGGDAGA